MCLYDMNHQQPSFCDNVSSQPTQNSDSNLDYLGIVKPSKGATLALDVTNEDLKIWILGLKSVSWEQPLLRLPSITLDLSLKHIHLIYIAPAIATEDPSKNPIKEGALTAEAGLTVLLKVRVSCVMPFLTNKAHCFT